jgi:hypothetical protein
MDESPVRLALLLIPFVLACFALSPQARAVCQEGCDTSNSNTFLGEDALLNNTTGSFNMAIGFNALFSNTTGDSNSASGYRAMLTNTTGSDNTANGFAALFNNLTGKQNTAIGFDALFNNAAGKNNIAVGFNAGILVTGSNNIDIGNEGLLAESNTIRIGKTGTHTRTSIAGIYGVPLAQGVGVIVSPNGHLGTITSSARFKEAINPMDKASEAILGLKPVTFRYKHDLDPDGILQFGLVAEDVQKVNPALVARDEQGKPYTVRYEAVNAMLLNEFLKEHRMVQEQQKEIEALKAELKEQRSLIQKVSTQNLFAK